MEIWGKWEFSPSTNELLNKLSLRLSSENQSQLSNDWLTLLNYNSDSSTSSPMETDSIEVDSNEEKILNLIKKDLKNDANLSETIFVGVSLNSMSRILSSIGSFVNEPGLCCFCKSINSWSFDALIELAMTLVVLPKLKQITEASTCVTFAIKELAVSKPSQFCDYVLIPLLFNNTVPFTDVELLSRVFSVLPTSQKDMIILNFSQKTEFSENDWLLLYPIVRDMSQNSLLILLESIQKFSNMFTKSQIFGKFLVNFCKNFNLVSNKDVIREVVEGHQTLLGVQALNYLERNV